MAGLEETYRKQRSRRRIGERLLQRRLDPLPRSPPPTRCDWGTFLGLEGGELVEDKSERGNMV